MRNAIDSSDTGSKACSTYTSGEYFATLHNPDQDAEFKANQFLRVLTRVQARKSLRISSYIDVGCGGGGTALAVASGLRRAGQSLRSVKGYDVSPHVLGLRRDGIEFVYQDFCTSHEYADLVTLFDVIEHVPDPVQFIKNVACRCDYIAFSIPLDHSLVNTFFDRFRIRLNYPGHLIYFDTVTALNLLAMSGLVVLDYDYALGFNAPSGRETALQRLALPFRWAIAKLNPWLASRTVGGIGLMVIAATPSGLRAVHP